MTIGTVGICIFFVIMFLIMFLRTLVIQLQELEGYSIHHVREFFKVIVCFSIFAGLFWFVTIPILILRMIANDLKYMSEPWKWQ